ncbi:MAG: DUF1488 family protein [Pseudolabrys sp.]|jgi:Protein of unknown function (DUF1488)
MSIHLDGLNPYMRDDRIEFPADVNGKRICCAIDRTVLERLGVTTGGHDLISLFKQNWPKIRDAAYLKIQMDNKPDANSRVVLQQADFEEG